MKRIARFSLPVLLALSGQVFGNSPIIAAGRSVTDTSAVEVAGKTVSAVILKGNLATFHAASGKNYFDLNWNTIDGQFDHFDIERSYDGVQFEKLGEVKPADVNATEGKYYFRDNVKAITARKNDFYYRLKQVALDGNISYSKVLIARMYNTKALAAVSVTPDPIQNDILVNVQLKEDSYVTMKVSDADGNLLMHQSQHAVLGTTTYTLDGTHDLKAGMYTLEVVVNSGERLVMKLQKG